MEITQLALWVLGIACTVLGWFARELYTATQTLRKDLGALERRISDDYLRYDRMQDVMKPILYALQEIKQELHRKANKP